jgi:hypothetical protein
LRQVGSVGRGDSPTRSETELADAIGARLWVTGKRLFGRDFAERMPMFLFDTSIVSMFDTQFLL